MGKPTKSKSTKATITQFYGDKWLRHTEDSYTHLAGMQGGECKGKEKGWKALGGP